MARDPVLSVQTPRNIQAPVLLAAALLQIATARLTDVLHIGQSVAVRSSLTSHPLVPWGYAFIIWGVIYAYALGTALWQLGPKHRSNETLREVGWQTAGIYLINAVWQVWVPLRGLDGGSVVLVVAALTLGISSLVRLRRMDLSRRDEMLVAGPLALVTGWLTAAACVNISSALVSAHVSGLNPIDPGVSLAFLAALIVFGGFVVVATHSTLYSLSLIWALFWIMMANIYRDHVMAMATVSLIGILIVAGLLGRQMYESGHHGEPIHA